MLLSKISIRRFKKKNINERQILEFRNCTGKKKLFQRHFEIFYQNLSDQKIKKIELFAIEAIIFPEYK